MGYGVSWQLGKWRCCSCLPSAGIRWGYSSGRFWWGLWYYLDGGCRVQVRKLEFAETIMVIWGESCFCVIIYWLHLQLPSVGICCILNMNILLLPKNKNVRVWSLPWHWHILSIPLTTGWGSSSETCGLDDVFPPDDLCSRPEALCFYIYIYLPAIRRIVLRRVSFNYDKGKNTNPKWNILDRMCPKNEFVQPAYDGRWMVPLLFLLGWLTRKGILYNKTLISRQDGPNFVNGIFNASPWRKTFKFQIQSR